MANNVLSEALASWKGTTNLHGPNEYGSMRGIAGKIAWTMVILVVGGFCVWQMSSLCYSYATHRKQTNVNVVADVPFPRIAFDHPDLKLKVKENVKDSQWYWYLDWKASRLADDILEGKVCSGWSAEYTSNEQNDGILTHIDELMRNGTEEKASWAFPYIMVIPHQRTNKSEIMQKIRHNGLGDYWVGSAFHSNLANQYKEFQLDTAKIAKVMLAATGPKVVFELTNHTTKSVATVIFFVARDSWYWEGEKELSLYLARSADGLGFSSSVKLPFPVDVQLSIYWHLSVRFTLYERASFYCHHEYDEFMLDCVELCMIDRANSDPQTGCIPYLGEAPRAAGLPLCMLRAGGNETCLVAQRECESACAECDKCQPCTELRAQTTFLWHTISAQGYYEDPLNAIVINIDGQDGVVRYETVEYYGASDFFSQLGGLLGLCFGASILSLVHLFHSCCSALPAIPKTCADAKKEEADEPVTDQAQNQRVREILAITT